MRTVALMMLALLVAAGMPADAAKIGLHDECEHEVHASATTRAYCVRIDYPVTLPSEAQPKLGAHAFLWFDALSCGATCSALPSSDNTLTGKDGWYGLLYVDTNGLAGLQRGVEFVGGVNYLADGLLLV